jgi:hypothetical protein
LKKSSVLLLIGVFEKSFIKISNELSRNFQDFQDESLLSLATDEGDDHNLLFEKLGDDNSNNSTLVFLIQNIYKVFRQVPSSSSIRKKGNQWQKFGQKFLLKPAKPSSLSETELLFEYGAKIAGVKSVWSLFTMRRC